MELVEVRDKGTRSGGKMENRGSFSIKGSAKAFSILSDKLYSNKIKAVVRELSTNAYDAQVEAGRKDVPFLVHLPVKDHFHFTIRDYGTGLSAEDIEHLYTTYFESTKTGSNESIGCLGLGSKVPFAYTDSFEVISFYKGKKMTYLAMLDQDRMPYINHISTVDTKESNGLQISMAVKPDDATEFWREAKEVYQYFPVWPQLDLDNIDSHDLDGYRASFQRSAPKERVIEGDDWWLEKREYYYQKGGAVAIMGNIAYPISLEKYEGEGKDLLSLPMYINFKIGDLDIAASREALSYDVRTAKRIENKLKSISDSVVKALKEEFSKIENLYDARCWFVKSVLMSGGKYSPLKPFVMSASDGFSFGDHDLRQSSQHFKTRLPSHSIWSYSCTHSSAGWRTERENVYGQTISLTEKNYFIFLDEDNNRVYDKRAREHLRSLCVAFNSLSPEEKKGYTHRDITLYVIRARPTDDLDRIIDFVDRLGLPDDQIVYASDLFKKDPKSKKKKAKSKTGTSSSSISRTLLLDLDRERGRASSFWKEGVIDLKKEKEHFYYVEVNRYRIILGRTNSQPPKSYAKKLKDICEVMGIDQIHGIKTRDIEKVKKMKNAHEFFDSWVAWVNDYLDKNEQELRGAIESAQSPAITAAYYDHESFFKTVKKCGYDNQLAQTTLRGYYEAWKAEVAKAPDPEKQKLLATFRTLQILCGDKAGKRLQKIVDDVDVKSTTKARSYKDLFKKYPLLKHFNFDYIQKDVLDEIFVYIMAASNR